MNVLYIVFSSQKSAWCNFFLPPPRTTTNKLHTLCWLCFTIYKLHTPTVTHSSLHIYMSTRRIWTRAQLESVASKCCQYVITFIIYRYRRGRPGVASQSSLIVWYKLVQSGTPLPHVFTSVSWVTACNSNRAHSPGRVIELLLKTLGTCLATTAYVYTLLCMGYYF